jgi:hypothetical protein
VAPRVRVLSFGSAAGLVVAGVICAAVVGGSTGDALAIALITLGLGAALLLIFLEVGLSEDRDVARKRSSDGSASPIDNAGCGLAGGPAGPAERPVLLFAHSHLHELGGDLPAAATSYAEAARRATNVAERDHLVRQAARARAGELFS